MASGEAPRTEPEAPAAAPPAATAEELAARTAREAAERAAREAREADYQAANPSMSSEEVTAEVGKAIEEERVAAEKNKDKSEDDSTDKKDKEPSGMMAPVEGFVETMSTNWQKLVTPVGKFAVNSVIKTAKKESEGKATLMDTAGLWFMDILLRVAVGAGGPGSAWLKDYKETELDALEALVGMQIARDPDGTARVDEKDGVLVEWVDPDPEMLPSYKAMSVFEHTFGYSWDSGLSPVKDVGKDTTYKQFLEEGNKTKNPKTKERFEALVAAMTAENEGKKPLDETLVVSFLEEHAEALKKAITAAPTYDDIFTETLKTAGVTKDWKLSSFKTALKAYTTSSPNAIEDPNYKLVLDDVLSNFNAMVVKPKFLRKLLAMNGGLEKFKAALKDVPAEDIEGVDWSTISTVADISEEQFSKIALFLASEKGKTKADAITGDVTISQILEISKEAEDSRFIMATVTKVRGFFDDSAKAVTAALDAPAEDATTPE